MPVEAPHPMLLREQALQLNTRYVWPSKVDKTRHICFIPW